MKVIRCNKFNMDQFKIIGKQDEESFILKQLFYGPHFNQFYIQAGRFDTKKCSITKRDELKVVFDKENKRSKQFFNMLSGIDNYVKNNSNDLLDGSYPDMCVLEDDKWVPVDMKPPYKPLVKKMYDMNDTTYCLMKFTDSTTIFKNSNDEQISVDEFKELIGNDYEFKILLKFSPFCIQKVDFSWRKTCCYINLKVYQILVYNKN